MNIYIKILLFLINYIIIRLLFIYNKNENNNNIKDLKKFFKKINEYILICRNGILINK